MENKKGFYGKFGGSYVPEAIQKELDRIAEYYDALKDDKDFRAELDYYLRDYVGRKLPSLSAIT